MSSAREPNKGKTMEGDKKAFLMSFYEELHGQAEKASANAFNLQHSLSILITSGLFYHLTQSTSKPSTQLLLAFIFLAITLISNLLSMRHLAVLHSELRDYYNEMRMLLASDQFDEWVKKVETYDSTKLVSYRYGNTLDRISILALIVSIGLTVWLSMPQKI